MKKNFLGVILASMLIFALISSCGGSDGNKDGDDGVYVANIENGKVVYNKVCIACHMTGVAGAAALTNKERWDVSAAKGLDSLRIHAVKGYQGTHGLMPERGSCTDCSDHDLFDALAYILHEAGVEAK